MVIVGGNNAALSAAHAARERAERVLVLVEKAPEEWSDGNSYFMAGTFRTTFDDLEDLRPIIEEATEEQLEKTKLPPYTVDDFMAEHGADHGWPMRQSTHRCPGERRGQSAGCARRASVSGSCTTASPSR